MHGQEGRGRTERFVERILALLAVMEQHPEGIAWRDIAAEVPGYSDSERGRKAFQRDRSALEAAGFEFEPGDYSAPEYLYRLLAREKTPSLTSSELMAVSIAARALGASSVRRPALLAAERLGSSRPSGLAGAWTLPLPPDARLLETMATAISQHAALQIVYRDVSDRESERLVWPWAVHVFAGDWYVTGFDGLRTALRMFRFSRVQSARPASPRAAGAAGVAFPLDRADAIRRHHSTLPRLDSETMTVLLRPGSHPWIRWAAGLVADDPAGSADSHAGRTPSAPAPLVLRPEASESSEKATFSAPDSGAQPWDIVRVSRSLREPVIDRLLANPGDGAIAAPEEDVQAFEDIVSRMERAHEARPLELESLPRSHPEREVTGANERMYRVLTLLDWLSDGEALSLTDVAEDFGVTAEVLRRDLQAADFGAAALGPGETFELEFDEDLVSLRHGARSLRIPDPKPADLIVLVIALSALELAVEDSSDLAHAIRSARLKLLVGLDDDGVAAGLGAAFESAALSAEAASTHAAIANALESGSPLRMLYVKSTVEDSSWRTVWPEEVVAENGRSYLRCREFVSDQAGPSAISDSKFFRVDSIVEASVLSERLSAHPSGSSPSPEASNEPRAGSIASDDGAVGKDKPRWMSPRRSRVAPQAVISASEHRGMSPRLLLSFFDARNIRVGSENSLVGETNLDSRRLKGEILASRGVLTVHEPDSLRTDIAETCRLMLSLSSSARKIALSTCSRKDTP